jgi:hypothetical protein
MEFDNLSETEWIRSQLTKKIEQLTDEISTAGSHSMPYLLEKRELLESELAALLDKNDHQPRFTPAPDFTEK